MSPLVQDVYLFIIDKLDNEHLNILLKRVAQKSKGITTLSKDSPKVLRKRVIECLQKSSNRNNIFSFIVKSGLHDIIKTTQIRYDQLDMNNYDTYLKELEKQPNIPAMQGILFIIENGGIERLESFFINSKENVEKFVNVIGYMDVEGTNNLKDKKDRIKNTNDKLEKELEQIKMEYIELSKTYSKIEKKNKKLNNEINRLKQKFEIDMKKELKTERATKQKEINNIEARYDSLLNKKNEQIKIQEDENLDKDKKINELHLINEQLVNDVYSLDKKYNVLIEKINKKRILLLGDAVGVDLDAFPDKYFDVITVANLDIKTFDELYEKNKYDEVWLIDFQIPRSLQKKLKEKYPNENFEQIKDNSAFQ
ncbi:hypothetical protein LN421_001449 [Listeria monocytogenes]|nr:hypothetical protein [Listeria monocytogenes]EAD8923349.1 hypothetical protein [Listeria monocytogenes]EAD8999648.1 hypothetical protein [Listeria monocytogenes]EAD9003950.1 hypothetical protein [Listeria monocytogenes]ECH6825241.1 hypothetical protein [Listeria monocytogenes]